MTQNFSYRSPTTPGGAGWIVDLGNEVVRLGSIKGIIQEAELGAVAISSIAIDDLTGTAGHSSDAIVGLKQFDWRESAAPSGQKMIWTGYIGDRRYRRGTEGESPSLRTEAARVIDITLVDINSFLGFRLFKPASLDATSSFNRPAETDVARVTALLAVDFLSTTLYNGLVSTSSPVNMDAADYEGQRPVDVLNDCAQQSGKTFFVFYDEAGTYTGAAGRFALFYDFNDSSVFRTTMQVSNVLANIDNSTTFYPLIDAELVRDPSRVISGALWQNGSNSIYRSNLTTSYTYGYRDALFNAPNLKTVAQATARADRYLSENSTEDDRINFTLKVPAAHVNDWYAGQAGQVKFTHLPGYESYRYVRALMRDVRQSEMDDAHYDIHYECTPINPAPSGAFATEATGSAFSGISVLPRATTPGSLLFAIVFGAGQTTRYPTRPGFYDDPPTSGSPAVPPFTVGAWTVLGTATTDYSGQNIGGPCGMSYHPGGGVCTAGLMVSMAYRYVQPGEVTTTPVQVSTDLNSGFTSIYLWEIPTSQAPGSVVTGDGTGGGNPSTALLGNLSGNSVAAFMWATSAGHGAVQNPDTSVAITGTALRQALVTASTRNNDTDTATANVNNFAMVLLLPSGGAASGSATGHGAGYNELNWCGVAVQLPAGVTLPDIPYPANQSA